MSKHQIILMKKPPSQSPSPSPQREGHVAVAVHEVAVEVVAGAAVEVELRILPEALLLEISFSLLYGVVVEWVVAASRSRTTPASNPSITGRRI
jgi:hypothetical protein